MWVYVAAVVVERREIGCSGVGVFSSAGSDCLLAGVVVNVGDEEVGEVVVCERVAERLLGVEGALDRDIVKLLNDQHSKDTVSSNDANAANVRRV